MLKSRKFPYLVNFYRKIYQKQAKTSSTNASEDVENVKKRILDASLPFVAQYGWTTASISAGAESIKYPGVAHGLFEDPRSSLVFHLYKKLNAQLLSHLIENPKGDAKVGDFVSEKLRIRLEMVVPYVDRWPEVLSVMAKPVNAPTSASLLTQICDDIWFYAGDRSTDFTWYTKRMSLAAVYASSQLFLLQDKSDNYEETWKFMKRRLVDVRTVGTAVTQVQNGCFTAADVGYSAFHTIRNIIGTNAAR